MHRSTRLALAAALVAAAPVSALAADRKVPSADFPTIQAAVNAAQSGDRILVGKGVFAENVTVTQNDLQIIGKKTVWDGHVGAAGGICLTITGNNCSVSGITFINGAGHVSVTGGNATILRCISRGAGGDGFRFQSSADSSVERCTVANSLGNGIRWSDSASFSCLRNTVRNTSGSGIAFPNSDEALIERNIVANSGDEGIEGNGNQVEILTNRVDTTANEGIRLVGTQASVRFNSVTGTGDTGIEVSGASAILEDNTVRFVTSGDPGISYSGGGGQTFVDANTVGDVVGVGIQVTASGMFVTDNFVYRCGSRGGPSIFVNGDDNEIENNDVSDAMGSGLTVQGDDNFVFDFFLSRSAQDGVVVIGNANFIDELRILQCDGEGIENRGTNTTLEDSFFSKNRLDITRSDTGTWAVQPFVDVTFKTGGPDRIAEIDKFTN